MKLLIFSWLQEITLRDILSSLDRLNISYERINYDMSNKNKDDSNCPELYDLINKSLIKDAKKFDAVFSVNYFPDVAKACYDNDLLYISWSYDCPLDNVETTISLPTNRAFFFDRLQYEEYLNENNTVFHFPLAVNSVRLKNVSYNHKYASDVSFVGRVYPSSFPTICKYLDDYYTGYLKAIIESQKNLYGTFIAKDALDEKFIEDLNINLKKNNSQFTQGDNIVSLIQIAISLAHEATFENRLLCLGLISNYHKLKWYTPPESQVLPNIEKCPPVDYTKEMPQVFRSSKINLHIGLHAIPSGISLRQLDIMACGGFLLSSFQPEMFEYFIPGVDFDYFSSAEEALDKCNFYLEHDELRKKIVLSGKEKTEKYFNYDIRLRELLDISFNNL